MKSFTKKASRVRTQIARYFLGFFSLTGMMFIFQACYGTPQDMGLDVLIEGQVVSTPDEQAIGQVEVWIKNLDQYTSTDESGHFSLYCERKEQYTLSFRDTDGPENGSFLSQDTTVLIDPSEQNLQLRIALKQE